MTRFSAPISEQIWDLKYRFKKADGTPIDDTVEDTWARIANALAQAERPEDRSLWEEKFYDVLVDWHFTPAGRIVAGAGTERAVTLFNCYVMGTIPDSMSGIFEMLREAALTMQQGGGIGYDFTPIRPKSSLVKKLGADASGPLSFMDCWDAMCRTVMSAGSRRGAMMATMSCDHPDIRDFITAKQDSARLRMFNLSVLVTDEFMQAVEENREWPLVHIEPPKNFVGEAPTIHDMKGSDGRGRSGLPRFVHDVVKARDLWDLIMQSTYDAAEPGVIFIDRINKLNNLGYCETIAATNPCGEQPLPPYGACLLGSVNLAKLIKNAFTKEAHIDLDRLKTVVHMAVRMMDNVIEVSNFPLPQQKKEAEAKRRIGLGVTGLADALVMVNRTYGTDDAVNWTDDVLEFIAIESYRYSVKLAQEKGPFPLFNPAGFLQDGTFASERLPDDLVADIEKWGIRNALLTSIAPTGTISLYAGNVSSGIEPMFAFGYNRKVLMPDGSKKEERVEDYAVAMYRKFWEKHRTTAEDFDPDLHLPETFVTAQTLAPEDHIAMQAVAQRWVDSSISKTINLPEDISFSDFKNVYWEAYENGCKGCTTYRPNDITGSVLSVDPAPTKEELDQEQADHDAAVSELSKEQGVLHKDELPKREDVLDGKTYKIKVGDQSAVYLTVNNKTESDGTVRPFEIFLRSSDPSHDEWMVAMARTISAVLRRPYDATFLAKELRQVHSAVSGGYSKGKYMPSLVAAIGERLEHHMMMLDKEAKVMFIVESTPGMDNDYIRRLWDSAEKTPIWPETFHPNSIKEEWVMPEPVTSEVPEIVAEVKGKPCPKCHGYNFQHASGCPTCMDCGWSKCG